MKKETAHNDMKNTDNKYEMVKKMNCQLFQDMRQKEMGAQ